MAVHPGKALQGRSRNRNTMLLQCLLPATQGQGDCINERSFDVEYDG
jgi:hypothetical protein